jgi:hypothetical protein
MGTNIHVNHGSSMKILGCPFDVKKHGPVLFPNPSAIHQSVQHETLINGADENVIEALEEQFNTKDIQPVVDPSTGHVREYVIQNNITHRPYMVSDPIERDRLFPGNEKIHYDMNQVLQNKNLLLSSDYFDISTPYMEARHLEEMVNRNYDVIAITAAYGMGKSFATFSYFKMLNNNAKLVMLSVRRTQANNAAQIANDILELPLRCYLHAQGKMNHLQHVIVSLESLTQRLDCPPTGDYTVVLDEASEHPPSHKKHD